MGRLVQRGPLPPCVHPVTSSRPFPSLPRTSSVLSPLSAVPRPLWFLGQAVQGHTLHCSGAATTSLRNGRCLGGAGPFWCGQCTRLATHFSSREGLHGSRAVAASWLGQASSREQAGAAGSQGGRKRALGVSRLQETRVCLGCSWQEGEATLPPATSMKIGSATSQEMTIVGNKLPRTLTGDLVG